MTRSRFIETVLVATAIVLGIVAVSYAASVAAAESDITFPVAELGNCGSKSECHAYCDDLANVSQCVSFAEAHGLMSADEAKQARAFAQLGGNGPGGCTSKESCESYCEDPENMRQCLSFARDAGIMSEAELQEAEKVAAYLDGGGALPGGCRGEQSCKAYCESDEHADECMAFALEAGFMTEKEAQIFRKTGGTGPGGCRGRACESYCSDESNREQCIAFAMEHGLMSEEDKARMREGTEKAREVLGNAPPAVLSCIEAAIGDDVLAKVQSGEGFASPRLGEVLPQCFREVMGDGAGQGPFGPGSAATDCMRQIFGGDFEEKMRSGEIDPGARDNEIRECMQSQIGEGFLNDSGEWERPQSGEPSMMPEGSYGEGYREQYDERRIEMELEMREEIESQIRSGTFDPSRLPPDFRPEGLLPPPHSYDRPPEGMMIPFDGVPQDPYRSSEDQIAPDAVMPPPEEESGPVSAGRMFLANVLSAVVLLFGGR